MDIAESNDGVDPEANCRIEVKVTSYLSVVDGRREYKKGSTIGWWVDPEEYAIVELVKDVQAYYQWADYQDAEFWYVGEGNDYVKLCNDAEFLCLLRASRKVTFEMKVVGEQHMIETEHVEQHVNDMQLAVVTDNGMVEQAVVVNEELCEGDELLKDPVFGHTVAGPSRVDEEETEHYMIEGVDPEGDEPAGANEEWRYFKKGRKVADKAKDKEKEKAREKQTPNPEAVPSDVGKEQDHDPEAVPSDEAVLVASSYVPITTFDRDNPKIVEGSTFPDKDSFLMTFKQFCIKNEFETKLKHSDKERYRAVCKFAGCPWKIYVKKLLGCETFRVVQIGPRHLCTSTSKVTGKEATAAWIADRVKKMLLKNAALGAKTLRERSEGQYNVTLSYSKVWEGKKCALKDIQCTWEDSFKLLWNWKATVEAACPGSVIEISCRKVKGKMVFSRMFVALRPCVDGFLMGCRPYLGIDSTHLTGKYNGQLAAATAIDGHNWMYPVAYGIFDKETNNNWKWFMMQLKRAIGTPTGLAIHTDACKGLGYAVGNVFGAAAEHRECFRHLMANFRKQFKGDVLKYMWSCAWACTTNRYDRLVDKIAAACPEAITYLNTYHCLLWSRAKFSKICKVDYVNNNISECFNNWIKELKELPVVDLMDMIRVQIMEKIATRQQIANAMEGRIISSVKHDLNRKSRNLHYNITKNGYLKAEISGVSNNGWTWRYAVNLESRTCSCGQWEVTGKPCTHAIAYITSLRNVPIENYVYEYYSVERFKLAYQFEVTPMGDKSQWPIVDPGFDMKPPILVRGAGRPKKKRIKSAGEPGKRGPYQCKRCFQFWHIEKGCTNPQVQPDEDLPEQPPKKKTKQTTNPKEMSSPKKSRKKGAASTSSTPKKTKGAATTPSTPKKKKRAASTPSTPKKKKRAATTSSSPSPNKNGAPSTSSPGPMTRKRAAEGT